MENKYHNENARPQGVSELTNQNIEKPLHTCQSTPTTPICVQNYEGQVHKTCAFCYAKCSNLQTFRN